MQKVPYRHAQYYIERACLLNVKGTVPTDRCRTYYPNTTVMKSGNYRKIRLIESNAKCRHLKKVTWKGTLRQLFICLRPPPLLGWWSNFVGSEFGQIKSVNSYRI
jgi:hypothetical protein